MDNLDWSIFDTPAKRWLAVLAGAFVLTVAVLMHLSFNATTPMERAEVKQPQAEAAETVQTRVEPVWTNPEPMPEMPRPVPPAKPSPFEAQDKATVANDPLAMQRRVHMQAEYLRQLIADGKLPRGLGNLTKEQVDEMERKGILVQ